MIQCYWRGMAIQRRNIKHMSTLNRLFQLGYRRCLGLIYRRHYGRAD